MILADTSVWVEHFRLGLPVLAERLTKAEVLIHPFVIGELACGNLKDRLNVLADLNTLPFSKQASHEEVFRLVYDRRLWGKGIGWIDGHLLASALITECLLWTLDKRLCQMATHSGLRTCTNNMS